MLVKLVVVKLVKVGAVTFTFYWSNSSGMFLPELNRVPYDGG